jgi:hypothetical protein
MGELLDYVKDRLKLYLLGGYYAGFDWSQKQRVKRMEKKQMDREFEEEWK